LFLIAGLARDRDTRDLQGEFGVNFDLFVKPIIRPRLRDEDPAKSKYLTVRAGYRYLPTLRGEDPSENRIIEEATGRFYLPRAILLSDRNLFEMRFVETKAFSWRYRNRLSLERNFELRGYTFTPYIRAELFYDSRDNKVAKNAFTIGSIFPISRKTEAELYYEDQRSSSSTPNLHTRGVGLTLSLFF
jgi:hypothetical protein